MLLVTALAKAALTTVTFGLKLPAGVFLPTIAVGASFGRAVGMVMARWQRNYPGLRLFASCPADGPCISPPVYAVIGAASALGGVTRMTISLVAILFELSGAVDLTLQIMMSCMVCSRIPLSLSLSLNYWDSLSHSFWGKMAKFVGSLLSSRPF
jgi:chloride channel 3/4/5